LIFDITLLLTVCPVLLDDVMLFMQTQSKQDLWQWFTNYISTRTFLRIWTRKLPPLTLIDRSKSNYIFLVYFRISGCCKRRCSLCSYYTSEVWKRNRTKI